MNRAPITLPLFQGGNTKGENITDLPKQTQFSLPLFLWGRRQGRGFFGANSVKTKDVKYYKTNPVSLILMSVSRIWRKI